MAATRTVTGPVVVLPDSTTGKSAYYYQGAVLPDGLDEERVKACIADGLVSEDVDGTKLTADDLSVVNAGERLRAAGRVSETADASGGDDRPPKTANKAAWADFRGLSEEQANDVTLEQLKDDEFMASYTPPEQPQS